MAEETPLKMLEKDHRKVEELFAEYRNADPEDKEDLTEKICKELEIHAELEENLVYPLIKKSSDQGHGMIDHSEEDHSKMKKIIMQLKTGDQVFVDDETMQQLEATVMDHVKEEEQKVFPYADQNLSDKIGLGLAAKMLAMKQKLRLEK